MSHTHYNTANRWADYYNSLTYDRTWNFPALVIYLMPLKGLYFWGGGEGRWNMHTGCEFINMAFGAAKHTMFSRSTMHPTRGSQFFFEKWLFRACCVVVALPCLSKHLSDWLFIRYCKTGSLFTNLRIKFYACTNENQPLHRCQVCSLLYRTQLAGLFWTPPWWWGCSRGLHLMSSWPGEEGGREGGGVGNTKRNIYTTYRSRHGQVTLWLHFANLWKSKTYSTLWVSSSAPGITSYKCILVAQARPLTRHRSNKSKNWRDKGK